MKRVSISQHPLVNVLFVDRQILLFPTLASLTHIRAVLAVLLHMVRAGCGTNATA